MLSLFILRQNDSITIFQIAQSEHLGCQLCRGAVKSLCWIESFQICGDMALLAEDEIGKYNFGLFLIMEVWNIPTITSSNSGRWEVQMGQIRALEYVLYFHNIKR